MARIIGIDLGTTNSCVAFIDNGEAIVIPNAEGSRTTPSVIGFTKEGERRVGTVAKRQAVTNPENTVFAVKRLMGQRYDSPTVMKHRDLVPYRLIESGNGDAWVHVGDRDFSPPEISAFVLEEMKLIAESYLGEEVTEAVITVPAYFDDAQRQATKDAGRIAGLEVKRIINEPTAAAVAYGFDHKDGQRVVVYDLGGGTFDVSILEISDGVFSVKATSGDTHLGGEDFDNALVNHLAENFLDEHAIDLRQDRVSLQRLKEQAEKVKHELSSSLETDLNIPFIAQKNGQPIHLEAKVKRSELEIIVSDLVERTFEPCKQALRDSGLKINDIDEVLLVGGQTRMPLVQRRVAEFFGKQPNKEVNPDEVVAVGAAIQGAALIGQVDEVLLLDVTPLSLGVETGGGVFFKLIERNTTIPTRASEVFTTSIDNQPFVPIHVLQGERDMAADNKTLAKFELAPIPPAPRGVPQVEVIFDIDANGIVHVTAKDLGSGREQSVRIVASSGLSEEQIQEIVTDADQYKASDELRRDLAELRNSAAALLYTSQKAVDEMGKYVTPEVIEQVKVDIAELRELVDGAGDAIAIRDALQRLELSAYQIAEAMYGSVPHPEPTEGGDGSAPPAEG
jgi:molecular chaperone DnaK